MTKPLASNDLGKEQENAEPSFQMAPAHLF